jgi:hypothetical protein
MYVNFVLVPIRKGVQSAECRQDPEPRAFGQRVDYVTPARPPIK